MARRFLNNSKIGGSSWHRRLSCRCRLSRSCCRLPPTSPTSSTRGCPSYRPETPAFGKYSFYFTVYYDFILSYFPMRKEVGWKWYQSIGLALSYSRCDFQKYLCRSPSCGYSLNMISISTGHEQLSTVKEYILWEFVKIVILVAAPLK